jgi:GNAT superfamily N-acetyltransferase
LNRERVPLAFMALGEDDTALGGVALHPFDLEERRDRSPWIVGMIVRADLQGHGIGQALITALETWSARAGISRLWVCTETASRAVAFYQRCGYDPVEELAAQRGEAVTVLTKTLAPA